MGDQSVSLLVERFPRFLSALSQGDPLRSLRSPALWDRGHNSLIGLNRGLSRTHFPDRLDVLHRFTHSSMSFSSVTQSGGYCPLFALIVSMVSSSAHAQLVGYEGFEYPERTAIHLLAPVTNQSPAGQPLKYFTEIDTHAVRQPYQFNIRIVTGSVPTDDSSFPFSTRGNSLSWGREWADVFATIDPNFQFDTMQDNAPLYFSFIVRAESSTNPLRQIAVAFSNGSNHRLQIGVDDSMNTGTPRFFAATSDPQPMREYDEKTAFEFGKTYFLVGKVETSGFRQDQVQLAVFGPGDAVPSRETAVDWNATALANTSFLVSNVAITIWGGDSGGVLLDELRIGGNWEAVAVAPEPPEAAEASEPLGEPEWAEASQETDSNKRSSPRLLIAIGVGLIIVIAGSAAFALKMLNTQDASKPTKSKHIRKPPPPKPGTEDSNPTPTAPSAPAAGAPPRPKTAPPPPKKPPPPQA